MSKKVLIANRGEISLRAIRACKELGLKTVCIYSEGDKELKSLRFSDESVCVGPADPTKSYLDAPTILSAADVTGSDAIYPGYGFLAEDHSFAEQCNLSGFKFIGPSSQTIRQMGDKITAKSIVTKYGIDGVPGYDKGLPNNEEEILKIADKIGYPLIVKATAGGGGRGMKIVRSSKELINSVQIAKQEALNGFGSDVVYFEKFIENPRHIEVQVLSGKNRTVHLYERDCSIQRRHQKLIEETPSPLLSDQIRDDLFDKTVKMVSQIGYEGAGTVEFIFEDGKFYFLEMNTRIQVEHPVTEVVTGIDLIKEQIWIAYDGNTALKQEDIKPRGHAIECRINAEDVSKNFQPSPGEITMCHQPSGFRTRVDGAIYQGYKVTPYYDSMICKLICHGRNRTEAIQRMRRSLDEFVIEGIKTTIDLHKILLNHEKFLNSDFNVSWLDKEKLL